MDPAAVAPTARYLYEMLHRELLRLAPCVTRPASERIIRSVDMAGVRSSYVREIQLKNRWSEVCPVELTVLYASLRSTYPPPRSSLEDRGSL